MDGESRTADAQHLIDTTQTALSPWNVSRPVLYTCLDEVTRAYEAQLNDVQQQYKLAIEEAMNCIRGLRALLAVQDRELKQAREALAHIPEADRAISEFVQKNHELEQRLSEHKDQVQQIRDAASTQREMLDTREAQLQELSRQLQERQKELEVQKQTAQNAQSSQQELSKLLQEEKAAHKSCENALRAEMETRRRATESRQLLEQQISTLQNRVQAAERECVGHQKKADECSRENASLTARLNETRMQLDECRRSYESERHTWEDAELHDAVQAQSADRERQLLQDRLDEMQQECEDVRAQLKQEKLLCQMAQQQATSAREGMKVLQAKLHDYEPQSDDGPERIRWDAFARAAQPEAPERGEQAEKAEKAERAEQAEKAEKAEKAEPAERGGTARSDAPQTAAVPAAHTPLAAVSPQGPAVSAPPAVPARPRPLTACVETAELAHIVAPVSVGVLSEGVDMKAGFTPPHAPRTQYVQGLSAQARARMQQTLWEQRKKCSVGFGDWLRDSVENAIANAVKSHDEK